MTCQLQPPCAVLRLCSKISETSLFGALFKLVIENDFYLVYIQALEKLIIFTV